MFWHSHVVSCWYRMKKQAEQWGAELRIENVEFVDVTN
jgi:hypothetical protein